MIDLVQTVTITSFLVVLLVLVVVLSCLVAELWTRINVLETDVEIQRKSVTPVKEQLEKLMEKVTELSSNQTKLVDTVNRMQLVSKDTELHYVVVGKVIVNLFYQYLLVEKHDLCSKFCN